MNPPIGVPNRVATSAPPHEPSHREGPAATRNLIHSPTEFGLGYLPSRLLPDASIRTVCGFCSTGCALEINRQDGQVARLRPVADYPVNTGLACPKGWEGWCALDGPDRAVRPMIRRDDGQLAEVSWDTAFRTFCQRFKRMLRDHGPDSVAFLSSGQLTTEESLWLGCLTKFGMGWLHGDCNTRLCMESTATAYAQAFGFAAPPYALADVEASDLLVFVGCNPCVAQPIVWERVLRNRRNPVIIVVDPRQTETARAATLHLPLRPKSDRHLFYGLARLLIERGWIDRPFIERHVTGFADFAAFVAQYSVDVLTRETGLSADVIDQVAQAMQKAERVSFWWSAGVNQSYQGVRTAQSLINLALITGNIGRPGTGPNAMGGQANALGARLFGGTSSLPAGRDFDSADDREEVARRLGIDPARIPSRKGLPYDQILEAIRARQIRGLWIIGTNPAHSWIRQDDARDLFGRLEFLVVQDLFSSTETAQQADLILPAAGWGEKEGTVISSERRIGVVRRVAQAPGDALPDFEIFRLIAEYWGCAELFGTWNSPAAVFDIVRRLSQGQPCDMWGIGDFSQIETAGGIQWPCPDPTNASSHARRLFAEGKFYFQDGRARLLFDEPVALPEPPCKEYPFLLITGRGCVTQWNTQTRTAKSAALRALTPAHPYFEMHPQDAQPLGIADGQRAFLESRRARVIAQARLSLTISPGHVFLPMHYPEANRLTLAHFDPESHQPSYKDCAVKVYSVDSPT